MASGEGTRYPDHPLVRAELPASGYRIFWLHDAPGDAPGPEAQVMPEPEAQVMPEPEVQSMPGPEAQVMPEPEGPSDDSLAHRAQQRAGRRDHRRRHRRPHPRDRHWGLGWFAGEGVHPVVLEDPSDTWSHGVVRYPGEERACQFMGVEAVETGPVRATVRLAFRWQGSTVRQDVYLYAGDEALGLRLVVEWAERSQLLKTWLSRSAERWAPLRFRSPMGPSFAPQTVAKEAMHRWVDVATSEGGLTCASDFTYGYDLIDGRLRLTLLRSRVWADHGAAWPHDRGLETSHTDQGTHRVSLLLAPHRGDWASGAVGPPKGRGALHILLLVTET